MRTPTIVIIGGDAAGMSAASRARRATADAVIIVLEKGRHVSYSACGLPYFLSGVVPDTDALISRTPEEHLANGIDLRLGHEAVGIDTRNHAVDAQGPDGHHSITYDRLIIATGASPRCPPFVQTHLDGVFTLRSIAEAEKIDAYLTVNRPKRAVLIGGGYIGVELAEAFRERGLDVTLVDHGNRILASLDEDMSDIVASVLTSNGVELLVARHTGRLDGDERVEGVVFASGERIPADVVVVGAGTLPNVALARRAGIGLGRSGAIAVDNAQRTSAFHVYAAGDCAEARHVVLDRCVHVPLGTTANKQGRVAGDNAVGGGSTFGGIAGTAVCKVFDRAFARTGLTHEEAHREGFAPKSATVEAPSRSGYYENPPNIHVRLTYDEPTRRLLGGQLVGDDTVAKRVDVIATALHARMTIDAFADVDLSYAPPFAPVWDPLLVAANVVRR